MRKALVLQSFAWDSPLWDNPKKKGGGVAPGGILYSYWGLRYYGLLLLLLLQVVHTYLLPNSNIYLVNSYIYLNTDTRSVMSRLLTRRFVRLLVVRPSASFVDRQLSADLTLSTFAVNLYLNKVISISNHIYREKKTNKTVYPSSIHRIRLVVCSYTCCVIRGGRALRVVCQLYMLSVNSTCRPSTLRVVRRVLSVDL